MTINKEQQIWNEMLQKAEDHNEYTKFIMAEVLILARALHRGREHNPRLLGKILTMYRSFCLIATNEQLHAVAQLLSLRSACRARAQKDLRYIMTHYPDLESMGLRVVTGSVVEFWLK